MASNTDTVDANTILGFACAVGGVSVLIVFFNKVVFPLYEGACRWMSYIFALLLFLIAILLFIIYSGIINNPVPGLSAGISSALDLSKQVHITIP